MKKETVEAKEAQFENTILNGGGQRIYTLSGPSQPLLFPKQDCPNRIEYTAIEVH